MLYIYITVFLHLLSYEYIFLSLICVSILSVSFTEMRHILPFLVLLPLLCKRHAVLSTRALCDITRGSLCLETR